MEIEKRKIKFQNDAERFRGDLTRNMKLKRRFYAVNPGSDLC